MKVAAILLAAGAIHAGRIDNEQEQYAPRGIKVFEVCNHYGPGEEVNKHFPMDAWDSSEGCPAVYDMGVQLANPCDTLSEDGKFYVQECQLQGKARKTITGPVSCKSGGQVTLEECKALNLMDCEFRKKKNPEEDCSKIKLQVNMHWSQGHHEAGCHFYPDGHIYWLVGADASYVQGSLGDDVNDKHITQDYVDKRRKIIEEQEKKHPVPAYPFECENHKLVGTDQRCNHHGEEFPVCKLAPSNTDCAVSDWTEGVCSKSCGGGTKTKHRAVTTKQEGEGAACPALSEDEPCNEGPCPVDCSVGDFLEWSDCSAHCGGGIQTRTREVITAAAHKGAACPTLGEEQACGVDPCPPKPPTPIADSEDVEIVDLSDKEAMKDTPLAEHPAEAELLAEYQAEEEESELPDVEVEVPEPAAEEPAAPAAEEKAAPHEGPVDITATGKSTGNCADYCYCKIDNGDDHFIKMVVKDQIPDKTCGTFEQEGVHFTCNDEHAGSVACAMLEANEKTVENMDKFIWRLRASAKKGAKKGGKHSFKKGGKARLFAQ